MEPMLFVNLPVVDVARSRAFFGRLGFSFDALFCDQHTACMRVNRQTMVVLHARGRFAGYAATPICDPGQARETVVAFSAPTRRDVDDYVDGALAGGGTVLREPEDLGFMYSRSFCDLDGHAWEVVWMDGSRIPAC
ncbi:VOC family protein [Gordonia sp. NPDC003950]